MATSATRSCPRPKASAVLGSPPKGTRILFMCENQGTLSEPPSDYTQDICVMNADGSNIVNVINTPETFENWPSWGPAPNHDDDDKRDDQG